MSNREAFPEATQIAVNGIELEVFEAGRENGGSPIVLCHGWPEHAFAWRHQVPALVEAGHHVIVPNQRGYGNSSRPRDVEAYDIAHLSGDLVALLDHFDHRTATLIGQDWGSMVVWGTTLLHPDRVAGVVALSLPYLERGDRPWIEAMESFLGSAYYMVDFNRRPGVADAVLDRSPERFLGNLFRKNLPPADPAPGNMMIALAEAAEPLGEPVLNNAELAVFAEAFDATGFTPSINWYRNLDRNWHLLGEVDPIIEQPALMIYGDRDLVVRNERIAEFVPNVEVTSLDCGHWISQELPDETTQTILEWLGRQGR